MINLCPLDLEENRAVVVGYPPSCLLLYTEQTAGTLFVITQVGSTKGVKRNKSIPCKENTLPILHHKVSHPGLNDRH